MSVSKIINWTVIIVFLAFGVLVAVANVEPVTFSLEPLPLTVTIPLFLIVFLSILAGLLIGGLFVAMVRFKARRQLRRADRQIAELEARLDEVEGLARRQVDNVHADRRNDNGT